MTKELKLNHLYIGDSLKLLQNIPKNSISSLITDPPYNYEFMNQSWNNKEIKRRIKNAHSDKKVLVKNIPYGSSLSGGVRNHNWYRKNRINILQYQHWCEDWGKEVFKCLKPGGLALIFNSTRAVAHVQIAMENVGFYPRDIIVWKRSSGIPKGLNISKKLRREHNQNYKKWIGWNSTLRTAWEAIDVVQKPLIRNYTKTLKKEHTGLFHTVYSKNSGFQSDIFENIKRHKKDKFNNHPTVKPLELMIKLVRLVAQPSSNDIILDPFVSSGSTVVACKKLGVNYIGIDSNQHFINIAKRRLRNVDK